MQDYLRVVVAGDVDAGKSTLIGSFLYAAGSVAREKIEEIETISRRLGVDIELAYLLDSFEEERKNQLTIDTTQTYCKTRKGKGFIFIDVPGHKELIKNMLCGSSYADIAIIVVDVQKSLQEQTKRHALILKFLGINQIIIALNKMDLVKFNENVFINAREDTAEFFKKIKVQLKYSIPVSAREGINLVKRSKKIRWYNGLSIMESLSSCFDKRSKNEFRFPIQDLYSIDKQKVAVGTVIAGRIKKGDMVYIQPLQRKCVIKEIRVFKQNKNVAHAPESIGLVLDDMNNLKRGQVICKPPLPSISKKISANVLCLKTLSLNKNLKIVCTTQESNAQIMQIDNLWDISSLDFNSNVDASSRVDIFKMTLLTENPMVVERYEGINSLGRFVLQDNNEICAVGIIP